MHPNYAVLHSAGYTEIVDLEKAYVFFWLSALFEMQIRLEIMQRISGNCKQGRYITTVEVRLHNQQARIEGEQAEKRIV